MSRVSARNGREIVYLVAALVLVWKEILQSKVHSSYSRFKTTHKGYTVHSALRSMPQWPGCCSEAWECEEWLAGLKWKWHPNSVP